MLGHDESAVGRRLLYGKPICAIRNGLPIILTLPRSDCAPHSIMCPAIVQQKPCPSSNDHPNYASRCKRPTRVRQTSPTMTFAPHSQGLDKRSAPNRRLPMDLVTDRCERSPVSMLFISTPSRREPVSDPDVITRYDTDLYSTCEAEFASVITKSVGTPSRSHRLRSEDFDIFSTQSA